MPKTDRATSVSRTYRLATFAIIGAGLIWRVARYLANWPLWGDEAYIAVSLLTRDFAGLTRPLEYYQIAPPGFLWAELASIRVLGASELTLRLVPFLCGIGSLLLFWRLAEKTLGKRPALMAIALFSASFYPIRHANEVKPYSSDLFLSLVMTLLALAAWDRPASKRVWAALALVSAIGVWVSYPLILVSGGLGIVLGWKVMAGRAGERTLVAWPLLFITITVASWTVMYGLVARPQALAAPFLTQMDTWEDSFPPVLRPWALPWWLLKTHTGNMLAYPYGGNHFGSVLTTLIVVAGGISLWRRDRSLLILLLAPIGPALVAAALHRYPYGTSARISLFMAPAICLLAGRGLASIILRFVPRRLVRTTLLGTTAGLGIVAIAGAVFSFAVPYKDIDDLELKQIVQSFAAESRPGDRWIGFNGLLTLPRVKQIMLMPWLQHAAQFHFYVLRDAPVPVDWNPGPLGSIPKTTGRIWFLIHTFGYDHVPVDLLEAYISHLVRRHGPPEKRKIDVRKNEDVEALIFPPQRDHRR